MLLILSSKLDLAPDYLILRLLERGLPYFRVNSEELGCSEIYEKLGEESAAYAVVGGKTLEFAEVRSIWYRRGLHPQHSPAVSPSQRSFVAGEIRHAWHGTLFGIEAKWVNPIDKVAVAEHKLLQLHLAQKIGFSVPRTLVSNNADELARFTRATGKVICKPVYHGLFIEGEERHSAFTRRITEEELNDADSISVAPVLLQEEITRRADLRVTVIGSKVFGVRISSTEEIIDWRKPGLGLDYSVFEVSENLTNLCKRLLSALGLVYGAFDFIERPDGQVVFLEVNPTGEWAWLEDKLGLPMRDAFIRLFYGKATNE